MRETLQQIFNGAIGTLLAVAFGALFAVWLIGPPVAVIWETVDLVRMREVASGEVLNVKYESGKGGDRAVITYAFSVQGQQFFSDRYLPGFAGNMGTWTGGGEVGAEFPVGRQVTVHYSAADPSVCALEYGWFKWSVALTCFWLGLASIGLAVHRMLPGRWSTCLWCAGVAFIAYAGGEVFLGPSAIRVRDLHWHLLAWCGALACSALYAWAKQIRPVPAVDAIGVTEPVPDQEKSTPHMVFELLIATALLVYAVRQTILAINMNAMFVLATVFTTLFTVAMLYFFVACSRQLIRRLMWHYSHWKTNAAGSSAG